MSLHAREPNRLECFGCIAQTWSRTRAHMRKKEKGSEQCVYSASA